MVYFCFFILIGGEFLSFSCLPNNLFRDSDDSLSLYKLIGNNKVTVVLDYLYVNQLKFFNCTKFTLQDMIISCGFKVDTHKGKSVDKFKDVLTTLSNLGFIECDVSNVKVNDFISAKVNFMVNQRTNFFKLNFVAKEKIVNYKEKGIDNCNLLNVYCYIVSLIGGNNKYCYPNYTDIERDLNIAPRSISKYINVLSDMGLIAYSNIGLVEDYNKIRFIGSNVYVLKDANWKDNLYSALEFSRMFYINNGCTVLGKNKLN